MKTLALQKKLAARILGVGQSKVWFDPDKVEDIKEAITAEDIRELIKDRVIKSKLFWGVRGRAGKIRLRRKRKGRVRGTGKIRKDVVKRKRDYMNIVRKLRGCLKAARKKGRINSIEHNRLKKLIKAGMFKNRKNLEEHIKEMNKNK